MDKFSDFNDLFIKEAEFTECDDEDDLFANNGTESVRFCKAIEKSTNETVICKIFNPLVMQNGVETDSDLKQNQRWYRQLMLLREALILNEIHHPTIVNFKGIDLYNTSIQFDNDEFDDSSSKNPNPIIFLEFLENKSIESHINNNKLDPAITNVKREICILGFAAAIRFLHKRKILHRGLNPNTIWLDKNFYPKIFDFSTSRSANISLDKPKTILYENSTFYKAPELFEPENIDYGEEIDIFSLGRLIYLFLTGYQPFTHKIDDLRSSSTMNLQLKIKAGDAIPKFTKRVSKEIQELLICCWKTNPTERPSADDVYNFLVQNKGHIISGTKSDDEINEINNYVDSIERFEQQNPVTSDIFQFKLQF